MSPKLNQLIISLSGWGGLSGSHYQVVGHETWIRVDLAIIVLRRMTYGDFCLSPSC